MLRRYGVTILIITCLTVLVSACSTTSSIKSHPMVVSDSDANAATVYFVRPEPIRTRGIADTDVKVEIDEKVATLLSAGEYVALKIKPGKVNITLRSLAYVTSKPMPEEVFRSAEFTFDEKQKYVIHTQFTQEEFRGIYFMPKLLEVNEVKSMIPRLKPHGDLAKQLPIDKL